MLTIVLPSPLLRHNEGHRRLEVDGASAGLDQPVADTLMHCVHSLERALLEPETLYMQFHGGVYRSDDGASWSAAATSLPPIVAVHANA